MDALLFWCLDISAGISSISFVVYFPPYKSLICTKPSTGSFSVGSQRRVCRDQNDAETRRLRSR